MKTTLFFQNPHPPACEATLAAILARIPYALVTQMPFLMYQMPACQTAIKLIRNKHYRLLFDAKKKAISIEKEGSSLSRKKQSQKYNFLYNTTIIQKIDDNTRHQTPHFPIHITKQHLGCELRKFSKLRNLPSRSSS